MTISTIQIFVFFWVFVYSGAGRTTDVEIIFETSCVSSLTYQTLQLAETSSIFSFTSRKFGSYRSILSLLPNFLWSLLCYLLFPDQQPIRLVPSKCQQIKSYLASNP